MGVAQKKVTHEASPIDASVAARPLRRRRVGDRFIHGVSMSLAEIRKALGKTQVEVAAAAGLTQNGVSQLESRDDALLSTLRRYAEALGGTVETTIVVGRHRFIVSKGE